MRGWVRYWKGCELLERMEGLKVREGPSSEGPL